MEKEDFVEKIKNLDKKQKLFKENEVNLLFENFKGKDDKINIVNFSNNIY